jgi:hypothetical protein
MWRFERRENDSIKFGIRMITRPKNRNNSFNLKVMNENLYLILLQIAVKECVDVASLYIENGTVFRCKGNEMVGIVCQVGTPFWNAAKTSAELLARLKIK